MTGRALIDDALGLGLCIIADGFADEVPCDPLLGMAANSQTEPALCGAVAWKLEVVRVIVRIEVLVPSRPIVLARILL